MNSDSINYFGSVDKEQKEKKKTMKDIFIIKKIKNNKSKSKY